MAWQTQALPGVSLASGGTYQRVSDPWVTFAPDGRIVYVSTLPFDTDLHGGASAVAVSRSLDGGRTWEPPALLDQLPSVALQTDKEMIVTDPVRRDVAYAIWTRLQVPPQQIPFNGPIVFSRTSNGGQTWEPARTVFDPATDRPGFLLVSSVAINNLLFARPNGTLINSFTDFSLQITNLNPLRFDLSSRLSVLRSPDRGQTWSPPEPAFLLLGTPVVNPDNPPSLEELTRLEGPPPEKVLRTPSTPSGIPAQWADVTMDAASGRLYAVWQDARFSQDAPYPYNRIAFAMSADEGRSWSTPIPINQTPDMPSPFDRQAFLAAIQVGQDGTLAVTYYDFRHNTPGTGLLTDAWAVFCRPGAQCTDPSRWGQEIRLSDSSFDFAEAPLTTGGFFLGDYTGLESAKRDVLWFFPVTTDNDPGNILFRRLRPTHGPVR